ncbi:MAG: GNAT family N-acetyltransferase [Candidatus Thorarchaeota archaeon]|nr:GNAT family N-acetyltransferase [Candidatus Thorarchaeota archaeon]
MVTIRQGQIRDCKDLLTVYSTTRWFYRTRPEGFRTVEEVKDEHRGIGFKKWGWLVAEKDGAIVGEVVFRIEKSPVFGRIGIIRNMDIDVRFQKEAIGTQLTKAAEKIMKEKRVARIFLVTPPEVYNFWMKVEYFSRGSLDYIQANPEKIKTVPPRGVKRVELKNVNKLPKSMDFSNIALPGLLVETLGRIVDNGHLGKLFEFYKKDVLIGVSAILKASPKEAEFVIDVIPSYEDYADVILGNTLAVASQWKVKKVRCMIPTDQLDHYKPVARWSIERAKDIPVTRIV